MLKSYKILVLIKIFIS